MLDLFGSPHVWISNIITIIALGPRHFECTVCTDEAGSKYVSVVRFCTDDGVRKNPVVFDGFHANNLDGITNCTCVVNIFPKPPLNVTLKYNDILPLRNISSCGSHVLITQHIHPLQPHSCIVEGNSLITNTNLSIKIILVKDKPDEDTSYCFKLEVENPYELDISCSEKGERKTSTVDVDATTVVPSLALTKSSTKEMVMSTKGVTQESTANIETSSHQLEIVSNNPTNGVTNNFRNDDEDNPLVIYIAIGCGSGGGLFLVITIICLVEIARRKQWLPKQSDEQVDVHKEDDEYGLQYNTLYVSSGDEIVQENTNDESSSKTSLSFKKVAYRVEGNYSDAVVDENDINNRNDEYAVVDKKRK